MHAPPDRPGPEPGPSDAELLTECRIETFRSGGPGGQHQNTTESGVRLVHLPTGLVVIARESRSQHRNRARALERLREALERLHRPVAPRIPTPVPRRERERRLREKHRRSQRKQGRRPPGPEGGEG